jgi:hypothetical protein
LLAKKPQRGRLEFRQTLGSQQIMAAVLDYEPALPWWLYRATQALAHLWVMRAFNKHLKSIV